MTWRPPTARPWNRPSWSPARPPRRRGKKILEQFRDHLDCTVGTPPPAPVEYDEFLLCGHFGCTPDVLEDMDEEKYLQSMGFMRVKRQSDRLSDARAAFYG